MNNIFTNVLIYRRAPRGNAVQLCSISSSKTCTAALPSPTSPTPTPPPPPTPAYHPLLLLKPNPTLIQVYRMAAFSALLPAFVSGSTHNKPTLALFPLPTPQAPPLFQ